MLEDLYINDITFITVLTLSRIVIIILRINNIFYYAGHPLLLPNIVFIICYFGIPNIFIYYNCVVDIFIFKCYFIKTLILIFPLMNHRNI
jgi:hypothetical protein